MPVFSNCVQCNECNAKYRTRYGLGNNYPQETSFACKKCASKIVIGIKEYGSNIYFNGAKVLEGVDGFDEVEYPVQNLHPELPTRSDRENDPTYFQSTEEFIKLVQGKDIFEFKRSQAIWSTFVESWNQIKGPLKILTHKSEEDLRQVYGKTLTEFNEDFQNWSRIFHEGKWAQLFEPFIQKSGLLCSEKVIQYFRQDMNHWINIIDECINSYMTCRKYFEGTVLHQKYDMVITGNMSVSVSWEDIKSVYGDMYELVGDLFIIPTILNNIENGRKFDEFITPGFGLDKYLASDKANRGKNFELNPTANILLPHYLPWLRNGTHHKKCKYYPFNNRIEMGTGKGGKSQRVITLTEYLVFCNELFAVALCLSRILFTIIKGK